MPRYPRTLTSIQAAALARRMLTWFDASARDLPWRQTRDPYAIWVSEVMLQQTQVVTVVPYFLRFLKTFPTVQSLAVAGGSDVLRLWQGLGYYRRARDLHRAARLLVERHGGAIPNDADALAALPGFGRYTRNAVLSQAFDRRLPIVEANSARVLARLFACDVDLKSKEAQRWLWGTAEALLPRRRAGAFNQALMELGALVCRSGEPLCLLCPLAKHCIARADGLQQALPIIAKRAAAVEVKEIAIALHRGGKVLLVQRPAEGRWANLWEFPHGPLLEDETPLIAVTRLAWELTGLHASAGAELGTIRHGIMHFRVEMRCYESRPAKGRFCSRFYQRGKWLRLDELADYPISSPQRRLAAMLGERKSG